MNPLKNIAYLFLLVQGNFLAQEAASEKNLSAKVYIFETIYDSLNGIACYDRLAESTGGDSVRYLAPGIKAEGWVVDVYANGQALHRGFYKNGTLLTFKNFYPNGLCERSLVSNEPLRSTLELFYKSGALKKQSRYFNHVIRSTSELYENSMPKLKLEYDKEGKFLLRKTNWNSSGVIEFDFQLKDDKNKIYLLKEYNPNGSIKAQGNCVYDMAKETFQKIGNW